MRLIPIICMLMACLGCSTSSNSALQDSSAELNKVNVISITNEAVNFKASDVFAWQTDILVGGSESNKISAENIHTVKSQVKTFFNQEGYVFTDNLLDADYFLVGAILVEGFQAEPHRELLEGIDPGMQPSKEHGLATLLVGVRNVNNGNIVWRGAVQLLLANDMDDLTPEAKKARAKHAINRLLSGLFEHTE